MKSIILAGPFIGNLIWEIYYFAPHVIYCKKTNPDSQLAVFTRKESFDLYGGYSDYLIPLKLDIDQPFSFKSKKLTLDDYNNLIQRFSKKYSDKFDIIKHIYPDIRDFRYKIKWQFGRENMNYNFEPRAQNKITIQKYLPKKPILFLSPPYHHLDKINKIIKEFSLDKKFAILVYNCEKDNNFFDIKNIPLENGTSLLGYLIEIIKRKTNLIIGETSLMTNLGFTFKVPMISWKHNRHSIFEKCHNKLDRFDNILVSKQLSSIMNNLSRKIENYNAI